jgi:very-short-patch-repair endonuclease
MVLSEFGITLIRFTNDQVQFEPHEVKKKLVCVCRKLLEEATPTPRTP